jgi:hypothetical protein
MKKVASSLAHTPPLEPFSHPGPVARTAPACPTVFTGPTAPDRPQGAACRARRTVLTSPVEGGKSLPVSPRLLLPLYGAAYSCRGPFALRSAPAGDGWGCTAWENLEKAAVRHSFPYPLRSQHSHASHSARPTDGDARSRRAPPRIKGEIAYANTPTLCRRGPGPDAVFVGLLLAGPWLPALLAAVAVPSSSLSPQLL